MFLKLLIHLNPKMMNQFFFIHAVGGTKMLIFQSYVENIMFKKFSFMFLIIKLLLFVSLSPLVDSSLTLKFVSLM